EERRLVEHQRGDPGRGRAADDRQDHLGEERLDPEDQHRAQEDGRGVDRGDQRRARPRPRERHQDPSAFACSRSTNFWIFPVEVFGSGPNTTVFGTLRRASFSRQKPMISSALASRPGFSVTKAQGVSPHFSSGRATTAASITAGCWVNTSSTSRLEIFSPPEMMMSFERSLISIAPSGCQTARSPDRHQPSTSVFAVAPRFLRYPFITVLLRTMISPTVAPSRGTLAMVFAFATLTSSTIG